MTEIEMLREAAELMRQRAKAASEGPWSAYTDGLVWANRLGDPVSASTEPEDAEHIASWHPAVALAVADWLDAAANREQEYRNGPYQCEPIEGDEVHAALTIARAYLGEVAS